MGYLVAQSIYQYNVVSSTTWQNVENAQDSNNTYASRLVPGKQEGTEEEENGFYLQTAAHLLVEGTHNAGVITKVEIGIEGYVQNTNNNALDIRPVFNGLSSSDFYLISGAELGSSDDHTVDFVDVTTAQGAPQSWTWNDVLELNCKVWGENSNLAIPFNVYIDALYIRVSYNLPVVVSVNAIDVLVTPIPVIISGGGSKVSLDSFISTHYKSPSQIIKSFKNNSKIKKKIELDSFIKK